MLRKIASTFLLMYAIVSSAAQTSGFILPTKVPSTVEGGIIQKNLQQPVNPVPRAVPAVGASTEEEKKMQQSLEKIHFTLRKVIIKGNHVFSTDVLEAIFQSSINQRISLATLQQQVHEITKKYRESGYILSRAFLPQQTVKHGVVTVQVVEGYISQVTVSGVSGRTSEFIKKSTEQSTQHRPLQISFLERSLLLLNDWPGFSVKSVITPSKSVQDSANLDLITDNKRGSVFVTYDNYGTRYLGPQEAMVGASLYSLITPGDSNSIRFSQTMRPDEMRFYEFMRSQPISISGMRLSFGGNYTETRPQFVLTPVEFVGRNTQYLADLSYPFMRSREKNFYGHVGISYQNVITQILSTPFYQDRFRPFVMGVSFNNIDRWQGINGLSLDVDHGFAILGAHDHFFQSRPLGQTVYTRAIGSISRLQAVGQRFSFYANIRGQYAWQPLLATMQYGFGGPDIGRGYDPSEFLGDKAWVGKFEVRMDTTPGFRFLQSIQYYAFYDAGFIWNIDNVNFPDRQTATSTGLGMRVNFTSHMDASVFLAKPLTNKVAVLNLLNRNPYGGRVFFQFALNL